MWKRPKQGWAGKRKRWSCHTGPVVTLTGPTQSSEVTPNCANSTPNLISHWLEAAAEKSVKLSEGLPFPREAND